MEKNANFTKFFVANLKRAAQTVYPLVRKKAKLQETINKATEEMSMIQKQIDAWQGPIKEVTGGYTTEDLVVREVVETGKMDKDGKPVKQTTYKLKFPDTVVPPTLKMPEDLPEEVLKEQAEAYLDMEENLTSEEF